MLKSRVIAFALITFAATSADAVTVDFEEVARTGGYETYHNSGFTSQGFDFNLSHGHVIDDQYRYINKYASNNGSSWLMHDDGGDLTVSANGSLISLTSVDAGQYFSISSSSDVQVTGYRRDGTTIAQTIASKSEFQTNTFSGWSNLLKITFSGNHYSTYDNFVLSSVSTTAVPIPSPFLMMTSLVALLGYAGYRRKPKAA